MSTFLSCSIHTNVLWCSTESRTRWPLYLASGAIKAGWDPASNDPVSLLKILTGFEAKLETVKDDEEKARESSPCFSSIQ